MNDGTHLGRYGVAVRRNLWMVIVCVVAAIAAAVVLVYSRPAEFRAESTLVVGEEGGVFAPNFGGSPDPFTQTMVALLESEAVASEVVDALGGTGEPADVLGALDVSRRPESAVLEVSYRANDQATALRVLEEVVETFTALVDERLGGSPGDGVDDPPSVTVTVFDSPRPVGEVPSRALTYTLVAGVLGIIVGLALTFAREAISPSAGLARPAPSRRGDPQRGVRPHQ